MNNQPHTRMTHLEAIQKAFEPIQQAIDDFQQIKRSLWERKCTRLIEDLCMLQHLLNLLHTSVKSAEHLDLEKLPTWLNDADQKLNELVLQLVVYRPFCRSIAESHLQQRLFIAAEIKNVVCIIENILTKAVAKGIITEMKEVSPLSLVESATRGGSMIKVLIVHTCPLIRAGLRTVLATAFQVIGEATESEQMLSMVQAERPDVILLDGESDCVQHCAQIRQIARACAVIVLAVDIQEEQLFQCLRHGARAYVPATISEDALKETIERVANGEYLMTSSVLQRPVVIPVVIQKPVDQPPDQKIQLIITPREVEILTLISQGQSNKQVASSLRVCDQTVKNHMTVILKKFRARDRTAAVVIAVDRRIISLEEADDQRESSDVFPSVVIAQQEVTSRERTILLHIMRGQTNKLIGRTLKLSEMTVKNHITSILRKLQASDRTHAVVIALKRGIISLEEGLSQNLILSEEEFRCRYRRVVAERRMAG